MSAKERIVSVLTGLAIAGFSDSGTRKIVIELRQHNVTCKSSYVRTVRPVKEIAAVCNINEISLRQWFSGRIRRPSTGRVIQWTFYDLIADRQKVRPPTVPRAVALVPKAELPSRLRDAVRQLRTETIDEDVARAAVKAVMGAGVKLKDLAHVLDVNESSFTNWRRNQLYLPGISRSIITRLSRLCGVQEEITAAPQIFIHKAQLPVRLRAAVQAADQPRIDVTAARSIVIDLMDNGAKAKDMAALLTISEGQLASWIARPTVDMNRRVVLAMYWLAEDDTVPPASSSVRPMRKRMLVAEPTVTVTLPLPGLNAEGLQKRRRRLDAFLEHLR